MNKQRPERLATGSFGLLFWKSLRPMLSAFGIKVFPIWFGRFGADIAVWGRVKRSENLLARYDDSCRTVTFEDAFLRSAIPGAKTPPLGLTIDHTGVHFDGDHPSDLQTLLQTSKVSEQDIARANDGIAFLRHHGLSKYTPVPRGHVTPKPGYILVIDQVAGDASLRYGGVSSQTFADMLAAAQAENPDIPILIRTHPAAVGGKAGHYSSDDCQGNTQIWDRETNSWDLLENASRVYCVSSLLGFEAILSGHRPVVFGKPFYAGWGLSEDRQPLPQRTRTLSVAELFAIAMIDYPHWYDHARNTACDFEQAAMQLLAEVRRYWLGRRPTKAIGIRLWKRPFIKRFLSGAGQPVQFGRHSNDRAQTAIWGTASPQHSSPDLRIEDGFIRSRGLGAELTPPMSLVFDDVGIYYDPTRPSRLEQLIDASRTLPDIARKRAAHLRNRLVSSGVTKYNLPGQTPTIPVPDGRKIILVPGQVEDDASIIFGTKEISTNDKLLRRVRRDNPDAYIVYKPHPDVVAQLRNSAPVSADYDQLIEEMPASAAIEMADEIWTMTSLMGFEGLLRQKPVTCLGMPFYAGWGLTRDLGETCDRRNPGIDLDGLVHACLIDYPYYMDPVSGRACPPELAVERIASGISTTPPTLRLVSKLQGVFASYHSMWR